MEREQSVKNINELSIEKGCEEYKNSVKLTLTLINHQLDGALMKSYNSLDELSMKIEARTNFLEKNPSFLSCIVYNKNSIKCEPVLEFDEIKITLKEHSKRIQEKVEEIEKHHSKLFELVMMSGREQRVVDEFMNIKNIIKEQEEEFQDCLEKPSVEVKDSSIIKVPKATITLPRTTGTIIISDHSGPKPNKRTYDKISIQHMSNSDTSLGNSGDDPPCKKFQLFPDVPPSADIERRRAQMNIHGKLIQQLIATDSLEGFLKLMKRKPNEKQTSHRRMSTDIENKYTGSLWFFPNKNSIRKKSTRNHKNSIQTLASDSTCCNLLVTSSQPVPLTNLERSQKFKQTILRPRLEYYDLLDDIHQSDITPIKSEYPRRDNIYHPRKLQEAKSYLHRMMQENEKVWKKLLQPVPPKKKKKHILPHKVKEVQNLMEYLTAPQQKYLDKIPTSLIVMPVKIIYDNYPTKEGNDDTNGAVLITDLSRKIEDVSEAKKIGLQTKTQTKLLPESKSYPFSIQKKKEMLNQLRGLKVKNDNIQRNIQRAIDVIETKMIDLLSSPTDDTSSDAFNVMEEQITTVLKMMSDCDKNAKVEKTPKKEEGEIKNDSPKIEAERDVVSPKVKRGLTMVKVPEGGDSGEMVQKPEEIPRTKEKYKEIKKSPKETGNEIKSPKNSKRNTEFSRKIANIDEGERLLGQVDNVIKKIDKMYTKFYDTTKSKDQPKKEATFGSVINFIEGVQQMNEEPFLIEYRYSEQIPFVSSNAIYYDIAEIYNTAEHVTSPLVEKRSSIENFEEFQEFSDDEIQLSKLLTVESTVIRSQTKLEENVQDGRHEFTLSAFYTFFFSGIFFALNLDYAS